jgi:phage shock protein A
MNLFTRITATIGATAETAVSRFENHDAIAHSALSEARQSVAQAGIRHKRLKRSVDEIRASIDACEKQEQQWTMRAQKLAKTDQNRAIQCLEQRQLCRDQLATHTQNLNKHEALEAGMADRLKQLETRLLSMNNQREEMRSRESLAQATQVMDRVDNKGSDGVDAIFERWELNISDTEFRNGIQLDEVSSASSLQREMDDEERKIALKDELAALIAENKESNHE